MNPLCGALCVVLSCAFDFCEAVPTSLSVCLTVLIILCMLVLCG